MTARKLTDEQERDVVARYRKGERMKTIAWDYGMSVSGIDAVLFRNGVPRRIIREKTDTARRLGKFCTEHNISSADLADMVRKRGTHARHP